MEDMQLKIKTALFFITLIIFPFSMHASNNAILVQSTTSTKNSGFYDYILPIFKADTGIVVNIVAVGTGAAIKNARNCDGDVLLVHSAEHEQIFIDDGFAKKRHDVMYNDFVIVGPASDPANIIGTQDVVSAFKKIALTGAKFASRSDNSGTHSKEMTIWQQVGVNPEMGSGKWYFETGSGMGTTLNTAVGMSAYTLVDRASWHSFSNKYDFRIFLEGDQRLFNPYGIMVISEDKCPSVKTREAQVLIDWLISEKGQAAISSFEINGKSVFIPNTKKDFFERKEQ